MKKKQTNIAITTTTIITNHHHYHHVVLVARISLTLSRHSSLSFIAIGRSSGQHPVSSHSCWMYVRAGRPAFARPCVGVHKSTSLMSSSLLLQQCPACLVRLTIFTNNDNNNTGSESQDIGMESDIEKSAILEMRSGKRQMTEGKELPNQEKSGH